MSEIKFYIQIEMLSDWHIGSGTGRPGNVDRLVQRDADGLPYIPAKTLTGMWRDACEMLVQGLDNGSNGGSWHKWLEYIFGDQPSTRKGPHQDRPIGAKISISPARFPATFRAVIRSKGDVQRKQLQSAMTFVKPGVAIDRRSGSAKTDFLRFEELARKGAVLEATVSLDVPDSARDAALSLLLASTKLLERVGGKRRRGAGRCRVTVENAPMDLDGAIGWLERNSTPGDPPKTDQHPESVSIPKGLQRDDNTEWIVLPLRLKLLSPLLVYSRTVGNVVESLDFVPGTYLLPHVSRILKQNGIDPLPLFANGTIRVLPAMIEIPINSESSSRGRPVPMILFQKKEAEGQPFEQAGTVINDFLKEDKDDKQLKQLRTGYVGACQGNRYPRFRRVPMTLGTHNIVEDKSQRPSSDVGGVFSYQAIAPVDKDNPVYLRTEIIMPKAVADQLQQKTPNWSQSLAGECRLGRSSKDDYGLVEIEVLEVTSLPNPNTRDDRKLFVWLQSDVLLQGPNLRPASDVTLLVNELNQALGNPGLELDKAYTRVRRLESWQRSWGLPRPSLVGFQAGSCLVLKCENDIEADAMSQVMAKGIGLRTGEGYGQVSFNDPLISQDIGDWEPQEKQRGNGSDNENRAALIAPGDEHYEFARSIEKALWYDQIQRAALLFAADQDKRQETLKWNVNEDLPPMTQLGALRDVVQQVKTAGDAQLVRNWIDRISSNDRRKEKWPPGALECIRELFAENNSDLVWQHLGGVDDWPVLTTDGAEKLKQELWPLAVRALIDACVRAHKRHLENKSKGAIDG